MVPSSSLLTLNPSVSNFFIQLRYTTKKARHIATLLTKIEKWAIKPNHPKQWVDIVL